jgi:hypothetical protein
MLTILSFFNSNFNRAWYNEIIIGSPCYRMLSYFVCNFGRVLSDKHLPILVVSRYILNAFYFHTATVLNIMQEAGQMQYLGANLTHGFASIGAVSKQVGTACLLLLVTFQGSAQSNASTAPRRSQECGLDDIFFNNTRM